MNEWIMTAINYNTKCRISLLEVENESRDFWEKTYKEMKDNDDNNKWISFMSRHQLKLTKMDAGWGGNSTKCSKKGAALI
jgi:hypothetical protein